jgi:hypothetical protein
MAGAGSKKKVATQFNLLMQKGSNLQACFVQIAKDLKQTHVWPFSCV